jgi:hypothetical protein
MLKSKSTSTPKFIFNPYIFTINAVFDFNILTAFIRLGRARPVRGGVPSIFIRFIGIVLSKSYNNINPASKTSPFP